jgi:hypothetical protein
LHVLVPPYAGAELCKAVGSEPVRCGTLAGGLSTSYRLSLGWVYRRVPPLGGIRALYIQADPERLVAQLELGNQ